VTARRVQGGHGVPNEERFGVSQALAAGELVHVAGHTGLARLDDPPAATPRAAQETA
jgi:hypothetical protein